MNILLVSRAIYLGSICALSFIGTASAHVTTESTEEAVVVSPAKPDEKSRDDMGMSMHMGQGGMGMGMGMMMDPEQRERHQEMMMKMSPEERERRHQLMMEHHKKMFGHGMMMEQHQGMMMDPEQMERRHELMMEHRRKMMGNPDLEGDIKPEEKKPVDKTP